MAENKVFDSIMNGLNESLAYAKGDASKARKMSVTVAELPQYHDKEIKQIREDLNLTQKNFAFVLGVLGKAPEHLTENQRLRCPMIELNYPKLFRAYRLKEELRLILKETDPGRALTYLGQWFWRATHSRISAFRELGHKIRRHQKHILDTIRMHMSNARIESTNNKIKVVIRRSYGFRNLKNMFDLVFLCCSNLRIPLPNRPEVAQTL